MAIESINPATGKRLRSFKPHSQQDVEQKLQLASEAFRHWRRTSFSERAKALIRAAETLEGDKRKLGEMMTSEMGKTIGSAIAEVEKCAWGCRFYAEHAEKMLSEETVQTKASRSYVQYRPIGPVLAIMPWNFPFWQVFRFAAPALMAGNVGLLKHASNVPQSALAIEEIFTHAGFPKGVFQTLLIESGQVEAILKDDRVVAATLTGSEGAGRSVAAISGGEIKKTVLELGGSDPFIVMPSTNLQETAAMAAKARTINNGQSCIAAKRFIVADTIYAEFERLFVERMKSLRVGDPMDETTEVGPLATEKILSELHAQVNRAVSDGGRLLTGGRKIDRPGNYYEPTVIADVPRSSGMFYEEMFGPVAMIFKVRDAKEAVDLANDSPFGLGSSVWTNDPGEQKYFADHLEAGSVFINEMVASDPRLPFGGVKRSGYGRELSEFGIREFVNIQTVYMK